MAPGTASSHHGDKPENVANYAKMNRYHVQNLAYFAEKLSKIPDGDGTLLDHILIYKGSNMGNSHRHAHVKVPIILLGGLDGKFKGNRHIVFPGQHGAHFEHAAGVAAQVRHRRRFRSTTRPAARLGRRRTFGSSTNPLSL